MTAGGGVDYRAARSKSHRLQAESYRFSAQADRLFAERMAGLPETAETYAYSAAQSERLAGDYDRMADSLDQEIAATARLASALAALEESNGR